jgi:hypothetical protein
VRVASFSSQWKSEWWRSCAVAKERAAFMGEVASNRMTVALSLSAVVAVICASSSTS